MDNFGTRKKTNRKKSRVHKILENWRSAQRTPPKPTINLSTPLKGEQLVLFHKLHLSVYSWQPWKSKDKTVSGDVTIWKKWHRVLQMKHIRGCLYTLFHNGQPNKCTSQINTNTHIFKLISRRIYPQNMLSPCHETLNSYKKIIILLISSEKYN